MVDKLDPSPVSRLGVNMMKFKTDESDALLRHVSWFYISFDVIYFQARLLKREIVAKFKKKQVLIVE